MENATRELAVHLSHTGLEHWKALGNLVGYLKGKKTKGIVFINYNVLKSVMFYDSTGSTDRETKKSASGIFPTLGGKVLTWLSKIQRTVALSIT